MRLVLDSYVKNLQEFLQYINNIVLHPTSLADNSLDFNAAYFKEITRAPAIIAMS
jgi:hypothetical protein